VPDLGELWHEIIGYFWPVLINFGLLILAGFGAPVPEEIPTVALGIWVGSADPNDKWRALRWLALPVAWSGVILSDVTLYWIGRLWGRRLLQHRWLQRLAPPDKRQKIERNFRRYGVKILLMIRWVPAIRSPMFITAGISRLSFLQFLLADAVAAIVGHTLLFFLAWWFGIWFLDLMRQFEHLKQVLVPLIITAAVMGIGVYLVVRFLRRPFSVGDPAELPIIGNRMAARWDAKDSASTAEFPTALAPTADKEVQADKESRPPEGSGTSTGGSGNPGTVVPPSASSESQGQANPRTS
jgi:membrane protein DedA with SNARE-associated domain